MLEIDGKILSLEILKQPFACNVKVCKGACCVHGDSGAPLTEEEKILLQEDYQQIKPFLNKEGTGAIEKNGLFYLDEDKDWVTTLVNGKQCAYSIQENGITVCAIEKAYFQRKTTFRKPVSCHLYPVRTKQYKDFEAINYDEWDICKPALKHGKEKGIMVYCFVKEALERKFGQDWVEKLNIAAKELG
jgi:hypothetical protein